MRCGGTVCCNSAAAGFQVMRTEDHSDGLVDMVQQIQAKLLGAEIMAGLKKIDLPGVDFATGSSSPKQPSRRHGKVLLDTL